jgi:Cu-Zn family superoxide dismutase
MSSTTRARRARVLTAAATISAAALVTAASPVSAAGIVRVAGPSVVHDTTLFPPAGTTNVQFVEGARTTIVRLTVTGLIPNRMYGSHVHYLPCGATPTASGAHYQYVPDPATGASPTVTSTNPAYANPRNEIWLDFMTDSTGAGQATAIVNWKMPAERKGRSVVVHAMGTDPVGAAGARLSCTTLPL